MNLAGCAVNDGLVGARDHGPVGGPGPTTLGGLDFGRAEANVIAWGGNPVIFRRAVGAAAIAAPDLGPAQARALGSLAGWRAGVLDLREDALGRLDELGGQRQEPLICVVLGLPVTDLRAFAAHQQLDPLAWPPFPADAVVVRAGGFRGAGGPWLTPPELAWRDPDGRLIVSCVDGSCWGVDADVFGVRVRPLAALPAAAQPTTEPGVELGPASYLVRLRARVSTVGPWAG